MRTRRTKDQIQKDRYNSEVDAYNWYVVNLQTQKAETGFEYKEDAIDLLNDFDDKKKYKVLSKKTLKTMGIEIPNESWKYAKGGSLEAHGIEVGDTFIETVSGTIQKVKDKNGNIVFVDLSNGYRDKQPPLPFEMGGYTDLSKSKPQVINESQSDKEDVEILEAINALQLLLKDSPKKDEQQINNNSNGKVQIPEIDIEKIKIIDLNIDNNKILSLDDSIRILKQIYDKGSINAYEEVKILYLDNSNKVIGIYTHSKGGITGTIIDIEMVCALALKCLAKGVIMSHNHPSGSLKFSEADKTVSKNLKNALNLFNIALLDSIVITEFGFTSMTNEGILAYGGGIRKVGNREYSLGRNWTNDHKHHNKAQDYEISMNKRKRFDNGGGVEFIEYGNSEIMYEPHYKKYYANEMEFDTLEQAKKFIDSGEVPYFIKDAYSKGLFSGGGKTTFAEKSSAIAKNFVGKAVEPKYQKEYGKSYDFKEAKEVGNKIAGTQKANYDKKYMNYGGDFPDVGETVKGSDIDYDMKNYFNRTNKELIITTKDNKVHTGGSCSKFYNDLIFIAKDKWDIPVKDILKVKILK